MIQNLKSVNPTLPTIHKITLCLILSKISYCTNNMRDVDHFSSWYTSCAGVRVPHTCMHPGRRDYDGVPCLLWCHPCHPGMLRRPGLAEDATEALVSPNVYINPTTVSRSVNWRVALKRWHTVPSTEHRKAYVVQNKIGTLFQHFSSPYCHIGK